MFDLDIFYGFLNRAGIEDLFEKYDLTDWDIWGEDQYPYDILENAFLWQDTKEGWQFWNDINISWVKFLQSHGY